MALKVAVSIGRGVWLSVWASIAFIMLVALTAAFSMAGVIVYLIAKSLADYVLLGCPNP